MKIAVIEDIVAIVSFIWGIQLGAYFDYPCFHLFQFINVDLIAWEEFKLADKQIEIILEQIIRDGIRFRKQGVLVPCNILILICAKFWANYKQVNLIRKCPLTFAFR